MSGQKQLRDWFIMCAMLSVNQSLIGSSCVIYYNRNHDKLTLWDVRHTSFNEVEPEWYVH